MNCKKFFKAAFISAAALSFFSCADWFQDKVDMNAAANNQSLGDLFYKAAKLSSLDTPAQLFVSQGMYSGKINLTWTTVANATSYRIDRAVVEEKDTSGNFIIPEESEFETLVKYCYKDSYSDQILTNPREDNEEYNKHYFYRITAENYELNVESEPTSPDNEETRGEGWLFKAPSNVEAGKGTSKTEIKVTWKSVDEAAYYKIFRGEKENGTGMELIDTVRSNQLSYSNAILTSEQGVEFYYKIVAMNQEGFDSAYSSIAMGYSLKDGAPVSPSNVEVVNGCGQNKNSVMKIRWAAVGSDVKYSVYRSSSVSSVYSLVKNNITTTEYTDTSVLAPGVYYYYYVQAITVTDGVDIKSAFSEKTDNSYGFLLSAPTEMEIREIEGDNQKITLAWKPALNKTGAEKNTYTYAIYGSSVETVGYSVILSSIEEAVDSEGFIKEDITKMNFYKISTFNGTEESDYSSPIAPNPEAPVNVTATKTEKLDKDFVANKNNVYPVRITWEKPEHDTPDSYFVYRSNKPDSGFKKLGQTSDFEYIDSNESAKSGVFYYYKVISLNTLGLGKKGNNPADEYKNANGSLKNVPSLGYGALTADQWFREYNKTVINSQKKLSLMHKPKDTDKLGSETVSGSISGTLSYSASIAGLGAAIKMPYSNYADYYILSDSSKYLPKSGEKPENALSIYFQLSGNTDTDSNMSGNGNMSGNVVCTGMYPGTAGYGSLQIKSGAAGGGSYSVTTRDLTGRTVLEGVSVDWKVGEEER